MLSSLPKRTGIYFVKDSISNLQFKIQFRAINTLLDLPKYTLPEYINTETSTPRETIKNISSSEDEHVVLIKWQQKIFSAAECELYCDLRNCTSDQQKKYHEMLKNEEREKQTKKRRQRKQSKSNETILHNEKGKFIFTYVQEDNFQDPSELDKNLEKTVKLLQEEPFEQMYVYAALKPDVQLIALRWFKRKRLFCIYPDFTDYQNQPYFIVIDSDYRHLYSYGIEDVSLKTLSAREEQFLYLPELSTHWQVEDKLNKKFHMPPRNTQRCAIILSINSAKGFEYDNVHVRYHIKLPANTILEEGLLDATSQSVSSFSNFASAHIGLTWQITVLCEEQFDPSQSLRIFFEVISIDSWERERIEGYTHFSIHLSKSCQNTIELNCIRPVETVLETVNRFFIGGRRKFDYMNFICKQTVDGEQEVIDFYCRYGMRMQNTGQLNFSYQILTQRSCELLSPCTSRTSGMTLDDIMMAYREARRRLESVTLK